MKDKQDMINVPFMLEDDGIIRQVNSNFIELTGFDKKDLLGKPLNIIWSNLLKINEDIEFIDEKKVYRIFTKKFITRCVHIEKVKDITKRQTRFIITELPNSRFEDKNIYLEELIKANSMGIAVYTYPEMILIKASNRYFDFLDSPYNKKSYSIGKKIHEIIPGFFGSEEEGFWNEAGETGKVVQVKEYKHIGYKRGDTFWETSITPIHDGNHVKYLVGNSYEVTEKVKNRCKIKDQMEEINLKNKQLEEILEGYKRTIDIIEKKEKKIEQQRDELKLILNNISDGLALIDKNGKYIRVSKSIKVFFEKLKQKGNRVNYVGETMCAGEKYYDLEGKLLNKSDLPAVKVFEGEKIENEVVGVMSNGKMYYNIFDGNAIFDDEGKVKFGVIFNHDITDKIEREKELREHQEAIIKSEKEKNIALEEAIRIKDEFLYLITHEFKTPISIVSLALQAIDLICKNEVSENVGKYLKIIRQNTNRQLRLVNNLLDITRISSGSVKLNKCNFNIVPVINSIVNSVQLYAKQKKVNLKFNSDISRLDIYFDEEKLERIILNLLSNALKFTSTGKSITVRLSIKKYRRKDMFLICVEDEGVGIPVDKQKIIFDRFGQVESSLSRQAEGTGLGLHLVKLLVNSLDGKIYLKSKIGKGSIFTTMFPISISLEDKNKVKECDESLLNKNKRIIETATIEFSDIYF